MTGGPLQIGRAVPKLKQAYDYMESDRNVESDDRGTAVGGVPNLVLSNVPLRVVLNGYITKEKGGSANVDSGNEYGVVFCQRAYRR